MRLADLVATSRIVAETRSRSAKTAALADLLRRLGPEEIDPAVAWLSGHLRQGRIGLGPAAVRDASPGTASAEPRSGRSGGSSREDGAGEEDAR